MKLSSRHSITLHSPVPTSGIRLGDPQTNEHNVTCSTEAWGKIIFVIVKISNLKSIQLQKYHDFGKYLDICYISFVLLWNNKSSVAVHKYSKWTSDMFFMKSQKFCCHDGPRLFSPRVAQPLLPSSPTLMIAFIVFIIIVINNTHVFIINVMRNVIVQYILF